MEAEGGVLGVDGAQDGLGIVGVFLLDGIVDGRCEDGQIVRMGVLPVFVKLGADKLNGDGGFLQRLALLGFLLSEDGLLLSGCNVFFGGGVGRRGICGRGVVCSAAHEGKAKEEENG